MNNAKIFLILLAISTISYMTLAPKSEIPLVSNPTSPATKRKKSKPKIKSNGKLVRVYRNLNTGTLSAQEKTSKGWRVTMHPNKISLKNAKFKVNETSRKKVLRTKQKNVHAFIEGEMINTQDIDGKKVIYDPYKTSQFMLPNGKEVHEAQIVSVDSKGLIKAKGIS